MTIEALEFEERLEMERLTRINKPPIQIIMCCGVPVRKGKCCICGTDYNED